MPELDNWNRAWNQPYTRPVYPGGATTSPGAPTAGPATGATPGLNPIIQGLLTPGLVPDIARQSAEVAAGRGVAGSPAGDSTAVRMSEQNWLQRLGLANTLLSGEAGRTLPYQITPYQAAALRNQLDVANITHRPIGGLPGGGGSGGGGSGGGGLGLGMPSYGGFGTGMSSGPAGLGSNAGQWTLDDAYEWLGFGNFGSQEGDWTNPPGNEGDFFDMIGN